MITVAAAGGSRDLTGRILGPSVFFAALALYLRTLAPDVTFWDSGELSLGALTLGLPHPPAYPIFCILGRLFTLMPFGNVAYRTNLMSAVFGAATAWMVFLIVRRMSAGIARGGFFAAALGLFYAVFVNVWSIAVITEVYTINSFLLAVLVYVLLAYEQTMDVRYLHLSAFVFGLAFANHQSILLTLPGYAAYYLLRDGTWRRPGTILSSVFFALLAWSVNLYLPVRGVMNPPLDIGVPVSPNNLAWVLKLASYKDSFNSILGNLPGLITGPKGAAAGFAAAAIAVTAYIFRIRKFPLMLAVVFIFNLVGIMSLAAGSADARKFGLQAKFYVPAILVGVVFVSYLFIEASRTRGRKAVPAAAAVVLIAAVWLVQQNIGRVDNSRNWFAYDLAHNTLKSLAQDAIIFGYGDNSIFPTWYSQGVERYRDDVQLIYPEITTYPWYMDSLRAGLRERYGIVYDPPASLEKLTENMPPLQAAASARIQTYYDYSAMLQLKVPWEKVRFQGIAHLAPPWPGVPEARVWDRYVMRGVLDDTTNKSFAAESVLEIYAFELGVWAQLAHENGNDGEALTAFGLAKKAGLDNPQLDKWAAGLAGGR